MEKTLQKVNRTLKKGKPAIEIYCQIQITAQTSVSVEMPHFKAKRCSNLKVKMDSRSRGVFSRTHQHCERKKRRDLC